MRKNKSGLMKKLGIGAALGISTLFGTAEKADASTINVSTQLPVDTLVRDGTTQYQMNVQVDSTGLPTKQINATSWDVFVPSYFTFVNATLPSSNDFFDGFSMNPGFNFVDNTISGNVLSLNERATFPSTVGPSNKIGDLENIYFTVNTDAPLGTVAGGSTDDINGSSAESVGGLG